jgi:PAS domain S-box-containing protein
MTERSASERAATNRNWYRALRDATLDAVVTTDQDGRVVDWSPQAESLFGFSRNEAAGQELVALIVPERCRSASGAGSASFCRTGETRMLSQCLELQAVRRDGTELPVELSITPLRAGEKPLFAALIREASERPLRARRARMALESRLLHQVTSLSASANSFEDALKKCTEVMCSITGWPVGHVFVPDDTGTLLKSANIWHLTDQRRYAAFRRESERLAYRCGEGLPGRIWETGEAVWSANIQEDPWFTRATAGVDLEVRGAFGFPVSVNGETVAVLEFFTPDEITPDPQLLMLVGSIGTQLGRILERRHWEDERSRLAAIVDSSYDAIIGKSLSGTILSWNTGAEQIYGFSAEEAVGESIALILPDGMIDEEPEIRKVVRTGRQLTQFETHRRRKDGAELSIALTVSPIRDSQGRIVGSSSIERDITRRIQRERELEAAKSAAEQAQEAAEAANRTKTEFLANISHELRTPMNAIIGMLELSLSEDLEPELQDYLDTARDSAHTLLSLLDDLLDFSRMEAGHFELESEPFDLHAVVDGMIRTLSLRASEKGLELAACVSADVPPRLQGDGNRLRQVLMNLAGNAIKFTEQGEVVVGVAVESRTGDEVALKFSVKDTGIGIPPEVQDRIFFPFTQVDASTTRKQSGSGLGLAICRELVDKMRGRIWLSSTPERGTTFYFTARFRVLAAPSSVRPRIPDVRNLQVLVVDDNATNLAIVKSALGNWGMRPTVVDQGSWGLEVLRNAARRRKPFALVIVDALMPDMDGFTLVETMQNESLNNTAIVLMLSSTDRQTFRQQCRDLNIAAFLEKPVTQSNLLDAVVQALSGSLPETPVVRPARHAIRSLRVLLAEDTPANQKVVRAMLEKRGHQTIIADNGREAIEYVRQDEFDVILMDVQMPIMDGLQATAVIREMSDPAKADVPIIAMTAHARREDRHRCQQAGMDAYISKPLDVNRLISLVESTSRQKTNSNAALWNSDPSMDIFVPDAPENSAPEPMRPDPSVLDKQSALVRLGGNEQLFASMARFFLDDSPGLLAQIQSGLQARNAELVTRAAHSLKGLAANFDARATSEAAQRIESLSRSGNLAKASRALPQLIEHVQRLQAELQPYGG